MRKKNILSIGLCILFSYAFHGHGLADTYKWIDAEGNAHYSDRPPNSDTAIKGNIDRRPHTKENITNNTSATNNASQQELYNLYTSTFPPDSELSDKAKGLLFMLMQGGSLSKEEITKIRTDEEAGTVFDYIKFLDKQSNKDLSFVFAMPNPIFSSPESTWKTYNNALKNYDLETAYKCITPRAERKQRQIYSVLKKEDVIKIGHSMISIEKTMMDSHRAEYILKQKEDGGIFGYNIEFIHIFGNWKIHM